MVLIESENCGAVSAMLMPKEKTTLASQYVANEPVVSVSAMTLLEMHN